MSPLPKTRAEAIEQGIARYFTGKACGKGHIAERWTASKDCIACRGERQKDETRRYQEAKAAREAAANAG